MIEKQNEIINDIDNLEEIKKIKELKEKLNNNKEYLSLLEEFNKNKRNYEKENTLNEEIIKLRNKLFEIDELKEYLSIQTNIRLLLVQINNIIKSIVNDKNC